MRQLSKQIVYAILVFIILAGLYALISSPSKTKDDISLSQLVQQINDGAITKIVVQDNDIEAETKDGKTEVSRKESETGITETLKNYGVNEDRLRAVNLEVKGVSTLNIWLGIILPIAGPVLLIAFFIWFSARQLKQGGMQAFSFGQTRARVVSPDDTKERVLFKNVAGVKEAKEELLEIVDFLKSPKKFFDIGARIPRGVLLMGAPGTGKTLLARAVAGEAGVPFFHLSGSEFVEMFVGVGAARVRDLFKLVKKSAPAIIFIDEIDAVGRHRGSGLGGGHDEREQTLNQILVEMDGFETNESVIVMAATNRPDVLDPALLRPGRFDRRVVLDLPDISDREEILKIHGQNKNLAPDVNLRKIAERTPGFAGADLSNLMNEAAILAARLNRTMILQQDLASSIEKVLLGPERKSHLLSPKEKEIAAYHEAGHALVAASLPESDPVHKVTIVSRGRAAGYTLKLPTEDHHLFSKRHFLTELAVALGGYAAELLVFKELTTGPHNDLEKATDLARALVTKYGMSEKIGPISFGESQELIFMGKEISAAKNYSEATSELIDSEIKSLLSQALKKAQDIITKRRNILDKIASKLIEQESIEQEEFRMLVGAA
ncbi:MAG: cell division protein FtsH [Candidatus Sungbacteria bacterium RIFCSPLOWO2_02_FULL_48_13b]|uniref:ATP-dependent zinc metalloprotease FtsH n=2 Tax=Candidatus Sungiibacteriota TaxID=1817917 RepID=A0A1G2LID3_9BACT|nr:MAG: cell division protein FtsH [Candidatus Sungbacteria bacterium RIFCSPHIGHO2_02_FULL_49_20]OHA11385.1 MAG: cell division protein FtsH [Candidatus Sungbacteria bacterium RIFCSPLOWO2_02_FULL_48_13b]